MKKMYVWFIAACFATCIALFGCEKNGDNSMYLKDINGFSPDNSVRLSDLNIHEYELSDLKEYFGECSMNESLLFGGQYKSKRLEISHVNDEFPIECLRYNKNCYYTAYKVKGGGTFFVFWAFEERPNSSVDSVQALVYFSTYLSSLRSREDFNAIQPGISTYTDVLDIDPSTELCALLNRGLFSYSLLHDGNIMEVKYVHTRLESRSDLMVESKRVIPKSKSSSVLAAILPDDLPKE